MAKDIASLNFQFLIVARNLAKEKVSSASIETGLPPDVLKRLCDMSIAQVEKLCESLAGVSLFSLRLSVQDLDRINRSEAGKEHAIMAVLKNAS